MRERDESVTSEVNAETHDVSPGTLRGGHDARQMAHLRWLKERERKAAEEQSDAFPEEEGLVQVSINISKIKASLQRKALDGDVQAAREYRAWCESRSRMRRSRLLTSTLI